jgi:hypothetical protein
MARAVLAAALLCVSVGVNAGPVLVYRDFCPKDRPANAPRLTAEQAVERAKALLPREFCAPNWYISGCEYDPEWAFDTWRVYAQQYKDVGGVKDRVGREHSYVILDAVGNCLANFPGT